MTKEHPFNGSSYLRPAFSKRPLVIKGVVDSILQSGVQFDTIAFRGMSGALIAPSVADQLDKPLCMSRKEIDNSHSTYWCEGHAAICNYIIIDDLICSGDTIRALIDSIPNATCVGIFLYNPEYSNKTFEWNSMIIPIIDAIPAFSL